MSARILVTCAQMQEELPVHAKRLEDAGFELVVPQLRGQQFSAADLSTLMSGVVGFIAGDDELSRELFEASPDLKVLVRWGIGMDSVDHDAAAEHDVRVRNTPGVFGGEVADSAFGYMILLARQHHRIDASVRDGGWPKVEGLSLTGASIGVVGLGDIGRAVVSRARGFGMQVAAYDPYIRSDLVAEWGTVLTELPTLLETSQFVVLTCPLTPETFHLIDGPALATMREDAYVVNVARGPVVDEVALANALTEKSIAGAGLDVFEVEPLPADSPLRTFDNVILGAHNGSNTRQGVARASSRAVDILLEELARA